MATIDKSLPNTTTTLEIPDEEVIIEEKKEIEERKNADGNIEITMDEDGGAEVEFDPSAATPEGGEDHNANLADFLEDNVLDPLASELMEKYANYKESRQEWAESYREGLNLLGFKYTTRTEPFRGAASVTHPVLAEAVTQFQAQAYKELLPADGPVRTQIMGDSSVAKEEQSKRVKDFMNYQIMDQMKEYEPEFDQMLFYLPLSGSTFKKVYYDDLLGRAVSKFIPAEDLVVPYSATSLEDAEAVIHVIRMSENDLRKQQINGFYKDIDLGEPPVQEDALKEKERELEGIQMNGSADMYTILEMHIDIDLDGYEDVNPEDGEPTGIKLPFIVTIAEANSKILSIRRNYGEQDPLKKKKDYFVHFKFLPGLGFYGLGLIHMIGGLTRTATVALRQLLDAGTLANLPAGFKTRGVRMRDDAQPLQPGEFRDVDVPGGNIKDQFMQLPFKGPDQTLLSLMGVCVSSAQRFASIADMQVGDMNQGAAVGTTVALLERGSRVMSAIHKRLYVGLKNEFKLLAEVFKSYLPQEYPYDVPGASRNVKVKDFDAGLFELNMGDRNTQVMTYKKDTLFCQGSFSRQTGVPTQTEQITHAFVLAAGCLFSRGNFAVEVPYDPNYYFYGEEISMMLRAFTRGFSFFHIPDVPLFHLYTDVENLPRKLHWDPEDDQNRVVKWQELDRRSIQRLDALIAGKLDGLMGLGLSRSLKEYSHISGMDLQNKKVLDIKKATEPAFIESLDWKENPINT